MEEIKSNEITWRNQNQFIMPTCKFSFLILYLLFKNLFSTASTQLQEKDRRLAFSSDKQFLRRRIWSSKIEMREKFLLSRLLVTWVTLCCQQCYQLQCQLTQQHQRYSTTRNATTSYYSEIVKIKRPLFYFYLYLIFLLCFFKEETWWRRKSAVICAVLWSTRFETSKLNSDHDKFCLDHSLSNFSKAPLDNT